MSGKKHYVEIISIILTFAALIFAGFQYAQRVYFDSIKNTIEITSKYSLSIDSYVNDIDSFRSALLEVGVDSDEIVGPRVDFAEALRVISGNINIIEHCIVNSNICKKELDCPVFYPYFLDIEIKLLNIKGILEDQGSSDFLLVQTVREVKRISVACSEVATSTASP